MNRNIEIRNCFCGGGKPTLENDKETGLCFIECLSCSVCVGGLTIYDAILMWNAATNALHI